MPLDTAVAHEPTPPNRATAPAASVEASGIGTEDPVPIRFTGRLGPFCRFADGSLLSFYMEGKAMAQWEDTSIAQFLCLRKSWDEGTTWTAPERVFQFPGVLGAIKITDLDLIPYVDREGTIHIYCFNMLNWDERFPYEERIVELLHVFSRDGGSSWQGPLKIDYGHRYTGSLNAITQLSSGRVVLPFSYLSNGKTFVCTAIVSDDEGYTWTSSGNDVLQKEDPALHLESGAMEPVTIEMEDGRIWMVIRTTTGRFFESWSSDQGDTWSSAEPTPFRSSNAPAALVDLGDGRLLMCWNHSKGEPFANGVSYARQVLVAAIRHADGMWEGFREIAHLDPSDDPDHSLCYPWVIALSEGRFLAGFLKVHLARWKDSIHFGLVRFDLAWLLARQVRASFDDPWAEFSATRTGVAALPDGLLLERAAADSPAAVTWNFPMASRGEVVLRLKLGENFQGAALTLAETFLKPSNLQEGLFRLRIACDARVLVPYANEREYEHLYGSEALPVGRWFELRILWNSRRSWAVVSADGRPIGTMPKLEEGSGISYLRVAALGTAGLKIGGIRSTNWGETPRGAERLTPAIQLA